MWTALLWQEVLCTEGWEGAVSSLQKEREEDNEGIHHCAINTTTSSSYRACYAWLTEVEGKGVAVDPSVASGIRLGIGVFNLVSGN